MTTRRDVLKVGTVGVAAAAVAGSTAGTGCAVIPHSIEQSTPEANAYNAMLDRTLAKLDATKPVTMVVDHVKPGERTAAVQQTLDQHDDLFKRIVRSLYVTQSFRDLPVETQLHPAVQDRVFSHMDEIDDTMFALSNHLASQTTEQRTKLRDILRAKPDLGMQIAEQFDTYANRAGMSKPRRKQLREMMKQVTFRLKNEAPGTLIDEYTAKVTRLRGADGKGALALSLAEKLGQQQFWRYQRHLQQAPQQPGPYPGLPPQGSAQPPQPAPPQPPPGDMAPPPSQAPVQQFQPPPPYMMPPKRQPGRKQLRAGGYMLGLGLLFGALGALLISNDATVVPGAISLTAGALLVAIGFIVLIIGAILSASG